MSGEVLKGMFNTNKELMLWIFNIIWKNGRFPNFWKIVKVILIPKEGKDLTYPRGYRPICLLNI